ncbi:hypothetical protein VULLAG_LOCUS19577 [Vulpes lagopus]
MQLSPQEPEWVSEDGRTQSQWARRERGSRGYSRHRGRSPVEGKEGPASSAGGPPVRPALPGLGASGSWVMAQLRCVSLSKRHDLAEPWSSTLEWGTWSFLVRRAGRPDALYGDHRPAGGPRPPTLGLRPAGPLTGQQAGKTLATSNNPFQEPIRRVPPDTAGMSRFPSPCGVPTGRAHPSRSIRKPCPSANPSCSRSRA